MISPRKWIIIVLAGALAAFGVVGLTGGGSSTVSGAFSTTLRTDGVPGVVSSHTPKMRRGRVAFRLYCSGQRHCTGKVALTTGGKGRGTRRFDVPPGEHQRVRFRVPQDGPRKQGARLDFTDSRVVEPFWIQVTIIRE
jgi:hypothetical protein